MRMSLSELQTQFWTLMTKAHPKKEAVGLFRPAPRPAPPPFDIYRQMYWFRQREAMAESFPRFQRAVGFRSFQQTVQRYLEVFPSRFAELERRGVDFSSFLDNEGWPSAWVDLVRLEWSRTLAFLAPNHEGVSLVEVATDPQFFFLKLGFAPSVQLLQVQPFALTLWQDPETAVLEEDSAQASVPVVVSRQGFGVSHHSLEHLEALILDEAMKGADLGTLCNLFVEQKLGPQTAMKWISQWFNRQWIGRVTP